MEWNRVKKDHKDRNKHKNRIKRRGKAWLVHVCDINHNIPTTRRWARGGYVWNPKKEQINKMRTHVCNQEKNKPIEYVCNPEKTESTNQEYQQSSQEQVHKMRTFTCNRQNNKSTLTEYECQMKPDVGKALFLLYTDCTWTSHCLLWRHSYVCDYWFPSQVRTLCFILFNYSCLTRSLGT